jgi:mono/diheme cytochrome c family protein
MDTSEQIHLLEKSKLKSFEKTRQSAMPKYGTDLLSDKDLDDIVAYLVSVGAK